jgi:phosphodiesterase/alkaline phosphatase D-like protein
LKLPSHTSEIPPPAGFERETVDLHTYRLRHTLYKLDRDLQAAHASFPFAVIWDDHEVQNDYSGLAPEGGSPSTAFTARRAAVFLTGDWHSTFVNDLRLDFKDPLQPAIATEFVTPAITTGGDDTPYGPYYGPSRTPADREIPGRGRERRGPRGRAIRRQTPDLPGRASEATGSDRHEA